MTERNRFIKAAGSLLLLLILLPLPCRAAFSDVPSWCEREVSEMAEAGFLTGYSDGTFRPGNPITCAQFVAITARSAGVSPLPDAGTHWAAGYLGAALQNGWYDWDELPPTGEKFDRPIPRDLAVKILMRALLPEMRGDYLTESRKIRDFSALDGRYYEPVLAAYAAGVVRGDSDGRFRPHGSLSRAAACVLIYRALQVRASLSPSDHSSALPPPVQEDRKPAARGGVSENGWLQVRGTQLCNESGAPVVLRGMSSHGLQWYSQFTSRQAIRNTAERGANLFRVAMYTGEGGYLSHPDALLQKAVQAVDNAIANDLYVIIDWHILSDGNPRQHQEEAVAFFSAMAERYRNQPAVLYEICNEPNGDVTWARDIKPYAEAVIPAIRELSPKALILIGSGTWSQDIHLAAQSPLNGSNLMYTLHFYAGTHGKELRDRIDSALAAGLPIFVSEWGTSRADGGGGVFLEESTRWLDFLAERRISWANWSLCDKGEQSAALLPGTSPESRWSEENLSESGRFVFSKMTQAAH